MAKSYEDSIKELESIVSKLEGEETPLNEAISLFEKSQKLIASCEKELVAAERKLKTLIKKKNDSGAEQLEIV
jgi:exodeoxyribonuclease VII small subunit